MKYLIVNADDFGASRGINRGIIEAHRNGILTSTSLMVDMPACDEAARMSRETPDLSIGLHAQLTDEDGNLLVDPTDHDACASQINGQFQRFCRDMGRLPTHLDSHHNIHRDLRLLPHFLDLARKHELPMREHSPARYVSRFYGQWDGDTHLEQISAANLSRMLEEEVGEGFTELSCHVGYVSADFHSSYYVEREAELRTLCDTRVRARIDELGIRLVSFRDLPRLTPVAAP